MRIALTSVLLAFITLPLTGINACGPGEDDDDDDTTTMREREPNDSLSQANAVDLESIVTGEMSPGDIDNFLIQIPDSFSGYKVTLSVDDDAGDCFLGTDPNLAILDSSGSSRLYWSEDSVEDYCPRLSFASTAGSQYYAQIATAVDLTGDYTFIVASGGPGSISGTVSSSDANAKDTPSKALPILSPIVAGEVIVRLRSESSLDDLLKELREALNLRATGMEAIAAGRYYRIQLTKPPESLNQPPREWTLRQIDRVRRLKSLTYADGNRIFSPTRDPNDSSFADQWALASYPGINARSAWNYTIGSDATVVAIIDTGDDPAHLDLQDHRVTGYDFISNADNADDGDGPDPDATDATANGHGTHVAGIAAAVTDNSQGVAGVGWDARYMPLRVCGNYGCTEADIIEAITYAAGYQSVAGPGQSSARARVINMSLGGGDYCSAAIQDSIRLASQRGVIVVAAAGNSAEDAEVHSPSNCEDVISVGATDSSGTRASYSNYGATVDVMAPGSSILSTYYGNAYATLSGTSMASPHVAGLCALLKDINPTFSFSTVLGILLDTANASVNCNGQQGGCGAGLVDASLAVQYALTAPDDAASPTILVQATDVSDAARTFHTVTHDGQFRLSDIPMGTYEILAGYDANGDLFVDNSSSSGFTILSDLITITEIGEDVGGISLLLSSP